MTDKRKKITGTEAVVPTSFYQRETSYALPAGGAASKFIGLIAMLPTLDNSNTNHNKLIVIFRLLGEYCVMTYKAFIGEAFISISPQMSNPYIQKSFQNKNLLIWREHK